MTTLLSIAAARRDRITGIACGMGAGILWGLVFIAPELAREFGPLQLSVGRYLCYGLIAAVMIAPRWHALVRRISRQQWLSLIGLAFTGNTLYYILLVSAVQNGGVAMTSLVIGFLPVVITIIGSRERNAVPLRKLASSLLFCVAGVVCIGWQALVGLGAGLLSDQVFGLVCAVGALVSWTAFAVGNVRCLTKLQHISAHDWNSLIGLVTGAQSIVLIPLAIIFETTQHGSDAWLRFGAVSVGVAVLASIFGNVLWNQMSRRLPLTLVGQMILFETLFALLYGFLWEHRLPTLLEIAAILLVVMSVLTCFAAHRNPISQNAATVP
ncbi:MAG TPA: DMT family transporter [Spongiibacteraceae bacterium]|nr:DMT family transporter [Spongiibacteraceae bacterium]